MNHRKSLLLVAVLSLLISCVLGKACPSRKYGVHQKKSDAEEDLSDSDDEQEFSDEEESRDIQQESGKSSISKALKSKTSSLRTVIRFVRKHPGAVLVASIILYKRHRQIYTLLTGLIADEVYDPKTGKLVMRSIRFDKAVQLCFILYMVKRVVFNDQDEDESESDDPMAAPAYMFGPPGMRQSFFLANILKSKNQKKRNPAFVPSTAQHYTFESLNERYTKDQWALEKALGLTNFTSILAEQSKRSYSDTILVLDWTKLDTGVSTLPVLRDQVSFLLSIRRPIKEVVILLSSPGGAASDYAVAAAQVRRLRAVSDTVTVCVDTVAASGGYMIAVAGTKIVAAPFAVLGSIGVIGQIINVQKLLEGWGVTPLVLRGGSHKAPLGMIGEVTEDATMKVQSMIDITHHAFQRHVKDCRPQTAGFMEKIGNGDVVLGWDAMAVGMVDRVITSDEYLHERMTDGAQVLKLHCVARRGLFGRPVLAGGETSVIHCLQSISTRFQKAVSCLFDTDFASIASSISAREPTVP